MSIKKLLLYSDGQKIVGILHLPDIEQSTPCVITCHGYYSTKDSKKYVEIANRFCSEGFAVLRFDFRGCGESEGDIEETTLSNRVSDLESALRFIRKNVSERIGLLGSSLGGCVAIITAVKDGGIKAVTVWSTPFYLSRLFKKELFLRDAKKYNLPEMVKKIATPILIIHGDADELVPLYHANDLYKITNEPKRLKIMNGGDHRFTNPTDRKQAIKLSIEWYKKYLKNHTRPNSH